MSRGLACRRAAWAAGLAVAVLAGAARAQGGFDHSAWDSLLPRYVDADGRVAYRTLQQNDARTLQTYLDAVAAARPDGWPRAEQLAFWINTYNAAMVSAVLQGRTPETALGRVKLFKFWKFRAAGRDRTLDEVEHEILRRRFGEARIHFALVCAATSCPRLRREAYRGERLEAQLDDQARQFLNDARHNRIDPEQKRLQLSEIFRWFRDDFVTAAGSVPAFVALYVDDAPRRDWLLTQPTVQHLDYDWTLNAQPGQRPR
jgi:hypothetical protein